MISPDPTDQITVCICTFKRPELLSVLLKSLAEQETGGVFVFSIVVVDNDQNESARQVVSQAELPVVYSVEPVPNIAKARNRAVNLARGNYIAFIDDDEKPGCDWLLQMFSTLRSQCATGVLGPVLPDFGLNPPDWLIKGKFYQRARHKTGFPIGWEEARTGNVLLQRAAVLELGTPFREEFGIGGEDQDFFHRLISMGHKFVWCDEAPVWEVVPPHRWQPRFLITRALLRGRISNKHRKGRVLKLGKSLIAIPIYALMFLPLIVLRKHLFMRYFIRFFDHVGRVLAFLGMNPVRERAN